MLRDVRSAPGPLPSLRDKPKTIRVITKDMVRELIIPRDRAPASLIIGKKDFERIQESARPLPQEERGERLRTLKSRQDAAFESLRKVRSAELRRAELQDRGDPRSDREEEEKEKPERPQRARKPSGPSSSIVMLRDVRSAPEPLPSLRDKPKTVRVITKDMVRELM
ncbi:cilia- and flagella-associated protein 45-like [Corvus hawaiiensis]|uniref:cilia- and flagella-associated protein 45-like n=1 Tax=Corvus hawaiiensis TaxID=134902 RepID=UPI0020191718|nr:cilia- and flagella-associated protein 45-like [Corvus hawaiiensis]